MTGTYAAKYPRVFPASAPYLVDGAPSGAAGAIATLAIALDTFPQAITRITIAHTYQIADVLFLAQPEIYRNLAPIDDMATLRVTAAQQNVTANPVVLLGWQSARNAFPVPLPAPYLVAGTNQITFEVRRLVGYPTIPDVPPILPVAHVTVWTVSLQSDVSPASAPPSSSGFVRGR